MAIRKVGSLFVSLQLKVDQFKEGLNDAQRSLTKEGRQMERIGRDISTKFTLPLGLAAAGAVKLASDFESAFAGVKKTVDGSVKDYKRLETGILDMSKRMPASANEIARVAEVAGQLGQNKEGVLAFSETMIKLGETTNLSAEEAATSIARIQAVTKFPDSEVERFGSVIVDLGNNFATTEAEIVTFTQRMASSGTMFGLTASQIAAVGTTLSSTGINAEAGGTAMQKMFIALKTAVDEGGESLATYSRIAGEQTPEAFQKLAQNSPEEAFVRLFEGMKNIEGGGGSLIKILGEMGIHEQRLILSTLNLAKNSDQLREAMNRQAIAFEANTALSDEYAKRLDTFKSKFDTFLNRLTSIAIAFGNLLIPILSTAIDTFTAVLNSVEKVSEAMDNWILGAAFKAILVGVGTLTLQLAGIVAIAGPVVLAIGKVKLAFSALIALGKLALASNPMGLALIGVTLVAMNLGKILDGLTAIWDYVVDKFKAGAAALHVPLLKLKLAFYELQEASTAIFSKTQADSIGLMVNKINNEIHQAEVNANKWRVATDRVNASIAQGADNQAVVTEETKKTQTELEKLLVNFEKGALGGAGGGGIKDGIAKATKEGLEEGADKGKDSLIDAHKEAVQNWQSFFENGITGLKFDLTDMFKQVAVGFASEIAASLTEGLGGFDLSSPQDLGSSIAQSIFKSGTDSNGGFSFSKIFSMDSLFGSARPEGMQGPLLPSGDFTPGTLSTDPGGLFAGANSNAGYISAGIASFEALSKVGKSTEDSVNGITTGAGAAIGAFFGGPVGAQIGAKLGEAAGKGLNKAFGLGGATNPETIAREAAADQLNPILKKLSEFSTGIKDSLDPNLFNNFTDFIAERDFFPSAGDNANTFLGAGEVISAKLNIDDLESGQLGVMLQDALGGDIDSLRGLFTELNITQEEFVNAQKEAGKQGEITWLEVASRIRDANQAFGDGLAGIGNYTGAMSKLIATGGKGYQALIQMQNIGIEAAEAGITSLDGLRESLTASGEFTASEIEGLMSTLATNGITSIDQLVNASEDTLINLVAGMDAAIQDAGGSWDTLNEKVQATAKSIKEMDGTTINVKYNGIFTGDHPEAGSYTTSSNNGTVEKFARGGIVTGLTRFAGGMMGEAGPEGILPLTQVGGKLGVSADLGSSRGGNNVNINIDARGASEGVEASILHALSEMQNNAIQASVDAVIDLVERGAI